MPSYPSSTCATDGSNNSCSRHLSQSSTDNHPAASTSSSNSSPFNSSESSRAEEEAARMALYLNDNVEANPSFGHVSSAASVAAQSAQMKSYLDAFDEVMKGGE